MGDDNSPPGTSHDAPSYDNDIQDAVMASSSNSSHRSSDGVSEAQPMATDSLEETHLHATGQNDTASPQEPSIDADKTTEIRMDQVLHDPLPEVESSFVAPLSPLPTLSRTGIDDASALESPEKTSVTAQAQAHRSLHIKPNENVAPTASDDDVDLSLEGASSVRIKNISPVQPPAPRHLPDHGLANSAHAPEARTADDTRLSPNSAEPALQEKPSSSIQIYPQIEVEATDESVGLRYGKRPRFLKSRAASQRSSASSFLSNPTSHDDMDSDVTVGLGTDYALQSGGATPALDKGRTLETRLQHSKVSADPTNSGDESLRTPKAKPPLAPPTDTVLARRVMDIQVPDYLAKEYKSKGGLRTPRKPVDLGLGPSQHSGRSMTLKEQSSTIERLSKENFDLKLKVMFLSDRLDKLSEEGVKEMIQENVDFRTSIAILQRDNKALRRRVKELEKKVRDDDERPGTSRSTTSSNGHILDGFDADYQDREDELVYLRDRVKECTSTIDRLHQDILSKESEKRQMADLVKSLQSLGEKNSGQSLGRQEEEDVWKDLLEQETARREQADEDNRKLRDEIFRMKQELHNGGNPASGGSLHHTTNIYNITKKPTDGSPTHALSSFSGTDTGPINSTTSGSNTLLEELRREGEQLRHENAELRKEVGAQTSMLTSRNKEKERLYQEIEDLKMAQRRGGPAPSTIDSILDRSASQIGAHERSASRASGGTRALTVVDDQEREDLENKNATLRDKYNELKLENQTLMQELDTVLQQKHESEEVALGVQKDYEGAMADLMAMQAERDDLISELNELDHKHTSLQSQFEDLRAEAQDAIDGYEEEADVRDAEAQRLQTELNERSESFNSLQDEMRKLSEALFGLEDETEKKVRRIQQLETELGDTNKELEDLEAKLVESNEKAQRLLVQQENSQGEIAFLREEQESDKIAISRLEVSVTKAEDLVREEQERVRQLQAQIVTERERSESIATKDKKEMQHFVNELSREASSAKEEARKLRKSLTSREVEATEWKERLMELENNLREALGDLSGTRSSLLKSIAKLQRELENTVRELDTTKASLAEKDRIIKQRDALLESHGLEARKIADALEKERIAHRNTKHQFDTFQKTHQHVSRTVATQDARIVELETSKSQDKKRLTQLEATFKDQLNERNNLLLILWTRLSSLCGTDWAHDNSLINGRALPSLEAVATMLPGFSRNLMAAIKHIESIIGSFEGRIKGVEKDLWREYQNLENGLEARVKKLDRLEAIVRNGLATGTFSSTELQNRLLRMEEAYRQLKVENTTLRTANEVRSRSAYASGDSASNVDHSVVGGSPSPSIPTGPRDHNRTGGLRPKTGNRTTASRPNTSRSTSAGELTLSESPDLVSIDSNSSDPRWILRLRDLENKLKLEREGRTMDRNEASRRLREQEAEINRRSEKDRRTARDETAH